MLSDGPLDVLTGDYLAELTMLILARDRRRDPAAGFASTFLRQMEDCLGLAMQHGVRLVTNAGGVNPAGLADALRRLADRLGLSVQIGHVEGDAVDRPGALSANAYLGAFGIAACLRGGADVVVTGRVTDASLVVGPAIAHFGWARDDLDALAGATVAGHILECGAQATGGNFAFFSELPDGARHPGFPIAEIAADGSSVITKHPGTGGAVTPETVTAQLLYEIASPGYLGPDVVAHLDTVQLRSDGTDRVAVVGVRGSPPPPALKVGLAELTGYRNAMTFVLCGLDIEAKAALVRAQLEAAIGADGLTWRLARTDHPDADTEEAACAMLSVHVHDADPERAGRRFSGAAVELALASYPGCTLTTPPGDARPAGVFRSELVPQDAVEQVAVLPSGARVAVPPPERTAPPERTTAPVPDAPVAPELTVEPPRDPGWPTALGRVVGARSGDKGGDANLGVWARTAVGHAWLREFLTVERLKQLLPECAARPVTRHELPNLRAVNFVIDGLLGDGVAASTRFDPQAKALGEWLRARVVPIPDAVLEAR
ncbi:MAG: acyclic terpene utilization AtuA family protein [Micromonosporaceae bacterium]